MADRLSTPTLDRTLYLGTFLLCLTLLVACQATGPKAGGPHYLARFATEKVLSINTAAIGENAELFTLEEGLGGAEREGKAAE